MSGSKHASIHERWAHYRFSVVGQLLAAPPPKGQLRAELKKLAARTWQHPITGEPVSFAFSTIERWLHRARCERRDPVGVLRRKVRADAGTQELNVLVRQILRAQLAAREVRSYEAEYVGGLLHWDCHVGSRPVLTARGQWATPVRFGVFDDRSRLACHLQWYLRENAQNVAHGLSQAFQKRGLARAAMSDNGAAMLAAEITEGLARLGILHETTLAYSPYQNGKCECVWGSVEGRLMAMLEGVTDLTLATLNEATQAWCEYEYNRTRHSQTGQTPLERFLAGPQVLRPSPDSIALRLAFTQTERRTQRLSDGTLVIDARRFEVPNRYRHLRELYARYASWDLSQVHLLDERSGQLLCRLYPQDKQRNASGIRAPLEPLANSPAVVEPNECDAVINATTLNTTAPLLQKLLAQQSATGLPPAYLPKDEEPPEEEHHP